MDRPQMIFGAASFGMNFITPEEVQEVLKYLQQNSITRLDTAGRYPPTSPGLSEKLLGELNAAATGFTIDTKIMAGPGDGSGELEKSAIEKSLSTSFERLGVDQVNVLHCHRPDPKTPLKEQAAALNEFYKAGKFKQLGVSNFRPEMLREFLEICEANGYVKPTVYQGEYSVVNRGMEKLLLPILRPHGMVYNAFRSLSSGFLSGNLTHGSATGTRFSNDSPLGKAMQGLYDQAHLHEALKKLESIAESMEITTIEIALRWVFYHSALGKQDGVILGASKMSQLVSNMESIARGPLPENCVSTLEEIWTELEPVRGGIL